PIPAGSRTRVVRPGRCVGDVVELLADGSHFGLQLTYRYRRGALGIAHAIGLARDFVGDEAFCVVLGDNVLRGAAIADVAGTFESGPCPRGDPDRRLVGRRPHRR
ncbi:MAG: sugar phosphate nucleotidyltransferase, partial [Chloroflexota bacterium]